MASPTTFAKSSQPIFKYYGPASGRDWQEIQAAGAGDSGLRPETLRDEWRDFINTPNLLVLAGSGTSLGEKVGGPSLDKLWQAAKKIKGFAEVTKIVRHPPTDENIESLLSSCQSARQLLQGAVKTIVEEFVSLAENEIFQQCSTFLNTADLGTHKEFLRRLAGRAPAKPRLRLFTTNYDRCFEQAAAELGYAVVDGFSYSLPRRYAANFFNYDFVRRDGRLRETPDFIENVFHLLKLHGSVDWDAQAGSIVLNHQPGNRCLIYPVNVKLELAYAQPYLEMMGQFLMALRAPDTALLTLGFGFTDEYLKQPIRAAIESNPGLKIMVVDRACEAKASVEGSFHQHLKQRIAAQDDRLALVNCDFDQFVEQIPNPNRPNREAKLADIMKALTAESATAQPEPPPPAHH
jgi:hypothetical protein